MADSFKIKMTNAKEVARRLNVKALAKIVKAQNAATQSIESKIGKPAVNEIIDTVRQGKSPVAGQGAFPAYLNPKKYPGKRKPHRPVNLTLTGKFLDSLRAYSATYSVTQQIHKMKIGFSTAYGKKLEEGHTNGSQPHRQVIPNEGENFRRDILNVIKELYLRLLKSKL